MPHATTHVDLQDPVQAYDRIADHFADLSKGRSKYLAAIEDIVVSQISSSAHSLLDIGSGDGSRASRIAERARIKDVVLVEPSPALRKKILRGEVWPIRAEQISQVHPERRFDVITCLWNVLGHIRERETRVGLLRVLCNRLSPGGRLFLDVIHRYNAASYGIAKTAARYFYDYVNPKATNGDVPVRWDFSNASYSTFGHVFTHKEITSLAHESGWEIEGRAVVDYNTGQIRRLTFQGNLLYQFRRNSASDSASAETTSSTSDSVI